MFVEGAGRGHVVGEIGDQADHLRTQLVYGHRVPPFIVMTPHADALTGTTRRDEAGEDRFLRMGGSDRQDVGQDPLQPRHSPLGAFGKHPLHVHAEMNRRLPGRAVAQLIILRHGYLPESQLQRRTVDMVPVGRRAARVRNPASPAANERSRRMRGRAGWNSCYAAGVEYRPDSPGRRKWRNGQRPRRQRRRNRQRNAN